ncbi:MAG: trypsin-like serine protease [Beijerinckiaceae bacterium]|nr:trypsin-like serine protease [Beijerinckiaceae bacterium]
MKPARFSIYPISQPESGRPIVPAAEVAPSASRLLVSGVSGSSWRKPTGRIIPESVILKDDRVRIADANLHPWRMIASLTLYPQSGLGSFIGTGWFVHPKVLLTAGHCVHDKDQLGGPARRVVVKPGLGNATEPFGRFEAVRLAALDRWIKHKDPDYDIGCIFLNEPVGDRTGVFDLRTATDADLASRLVNISGYPADRDGGREQYFHANRVQATTPRSIFYDVDTFGGQSGSPVFLQDEPDARPIAIGIHAYGTGRTPPTPGLSANSGPRLTADVLATIESWVASA